MKNYHISIIDKEVAKATIIKNHYSHKWTSCRYSIGLFNGIDELCGIAIYGFPIGRQAVKSITVDLENNEVLELTRLWLRDEEPKNSESHFIAMTFDWLRQHTAIKVLISYSDPMAGHVGVIYQATNWIYQGNNTMLIKGYLHQINGEIMHPRSVVAKFGTINTVELLKIDPNYRRIETKKKHRYLYILHKKQRKNIINKLKHAPLPYPKDNNSCNWGSAWQET